MIELKPVTNRKSVWFGKIVCIFERFFWDVYAFFYDLICFLIPYQDLIKKVSDVIYKYDNVKILDAGCGTGNFSNYFIKAGATVIAIDYSSNMERVLRKKNSKINFLQINLEESIPFSDKEFDVVLCAHVLYSIQNYKSTIEELMRVLRPNGKLIIINPISNPSILKIFFESIAKSTTKEKFVNIAIFPLMIIFGIFNVVIKCGGKKGYYKFSDEEFEGYVSKKYTILLEERVYANQSKMLVVRRGEN